MASDVRIRVLADRIPAGCPVSCVPTAWDGYMELLCQLEKGLMRMGMNSDRPYQQDQSEICDYCGDRGAGEICKT